MTRLSDSDHAVTGTKVRARAAELHALWLTNVHSLRIAMNDDPHEVGERVAASQVREDKTREYLIEFVEAHDLNCSEFDPRNPAPAVGEAVADTDDRVEGERDDER